MHAYNFGARGSNLTKFFQVTCHEAGMITWVQFFGGLPPPLRIWEGINRPKFGAILRNFTLWSQISPERMKLSTSQKRRYQQQSLPRSTKKLVKFHKQKSYRRACWPTQSQILRKTIFWRLFSTDSFPSVLFPPSPLCSCLSSGIC